MMPARRWSRKKTTCLVRRLRFSRLTWSQMPAMMSTMAPAMLTVQEGMKARGRFKRRIKREPSWPPAAGQPYLTLDLHPRALPNIDDLLWYNGSSSIMNILRYMPLRSPSGDYVSKKPCCVSCVSSCCMFGIYTPCMSDYFTTAKRYLCVCGYSNVLLKRVFERCPDYLCISQPHTQPHSIESTIGRTATEL